MLQFLLLVLILTGLGFTVWRMSRTGIRRPKTRMIGPDDDPDFLRRLGRPDNDPR